MSWALAAGAAIPLGTSIYKGIKGAQQIKASNDILARDPGYQMNQGVLDNAKTVSDFYGNYQLPGYNQDVNNINSTFNGAFTAGKQGATSGADVQDLATRMAYGKNQAFNQLGQQNAQGKQGAFGQYLNAQAAAGQEYVNKNQFENERYQALLKQKAALTQAGAENIYGAIDSGAQIASKLIQTKLDQGKSDDNNGLSSVNSGGTTGAAAYNKWFYPNGSLRFDASGNPIQPVMDKSQPPSFNY